MSVLLTVIHFDTFWVLATSHHYIPVWTFDMEGKRWWAGGEISEKLTASYGGRVTWIKNTKTLRINWTSLKNWTYGICNPWTRINMHSFSRFLLNTGEICFLGSPDPSPYLVDLDFGVAQSVFGKRGWECRAEWYYIPESWQIPKSRPGWQSGYTDKATRYEKVRKVLCPRIVLYPRNPSVCQESFFGGFWRNVWVNQWENHYRNVNVNVLDSVRVVYIIVLLANLDL